MKEDLELIGNKNESNRYQVIGMSTGMCLGVALGMLMGYLLFDNIPIGMCLGLSIGMALGIVAGSCKDRAITEQLKTKGYTILEIALKDNAPEEYEVKVTDRNGETCFIKVSKADMEMEKFEVGDLVYMDEDGDIEQAIDKNDGE